MGRRISRLLMLFYLSFLNLHLALNNIISLDWHSQINLVELSSKLLKLPILIPFTLYMNNYGHFTACISVQQNLAGRRSACCHITLAGVSSYVHQGLERNADHHLRRWHQFWRFPRWWQENCGVQTSAFYQVVREGNFFPQAQTSRDLQRFDLPQVGHAWSDTYDKYDRRILLRLVD